MASTLNQLYREDSGTNTVLTIAEFMHTSSGTPASGLGAKVLLGAENSGGTATSAVELQGYLSTVTASSEVGVFLLQCRYAGALQDALKLTPGASSTTTIAVSDDTDSVAVFGRCRLHSATTDRAQFCHRDRIATDQYALSHLAGGDTQLNATSNLYFQIQGNSIATLTATDFAIGAASTNTMTMTSRLLVRSVTDAGPMTATAGTQREIVYNTSDSKFYGCTVTHASAATWAALN